MAAFTFIANNHIHKWDNVSYICHHVNKTLVAAIKATLPRLALFLQLFHFLAHLHDQKKGNVTLSTIKAESKNRILQFIVNLMGFFFMSFITFLFTDELNNITDIMTSNTVFLLCPCLV